MRRFGWMELGFSQDFLLEAARRAGWQVVFHSFPGCGRANLYVLTPAAGGEAPQAAGRHIPSPQPGIPGSENEALLQSILASTTWRATRPLRRAVHWLSRRPGQPPA